MLCVYDLIEADSFLLQNMQLVYMRMQVASEQERPRAQCHLRDDYYAHSSRWTFAASFLSLFAIFCMPSARKTNTHNAAQSHEIEYEYETRGKEHSGMEKSI